MQPDRGTPATVTDVVIIGAGPTGLFQVFELGLLGLSAHLVDALREPGGQCIELYPDKPIYDIPAVPVCTGRELTARLLEQIQPFKPTFHMNQQVTALERREDGRFLLTTSRGSRLLASAVVIAAGVGAFEPRRLAVEGVDRHEGSRIHYRVADAAAFRGRELIILGGGDSAVDWALALADTAASIVLVHRRDEFRAVPDSLARLRARVEGGTLDVLTGTVAAVLEDNAQFRGLSIRAADGVVRRVMADDALVFWGLHPRLGPIAEWGIELQRRALPVDPARFETSVPGVHAIGDINTYPGKKKLILSGFHEAALAAFAIKARVAPGEKVHLQYTTTSPLLQRRLGVEPQPADAAESQPVRQAGGGQA